MFNDWQKVDASTPQYVQDVASGFVPRPGESRFMTFYGYGKRLFCIRNGPTASRADMFWIELPWID